VIEKLKSAYAGLRLKRESGELVRERKDPDFHRARRIGILYDASEREEFFKVREFFKDLRECGKYPVSLGYIDFTEVTFHPLARPEADYFFKSQLNWYQKPSGPVVENFIREPFDMLINLTLRDIYPIDYIAALSKAGLKIGREESAISYCYAIRFSLTPDADEKSFAYMIIHYLNQINVHAS
jgi:hypothetical protein